LSIGTIPANLLSDSRLLLGSFGRQNREGKIRKILEIFVPNQEDKQIRSKIPHHDTFKVLVIEEGNSIIQKMKPLFSSMKIRADHATNRHKAVTLAQQMSFDLVVLDIDQHTGNNLDLIEILKQHQTNLDFITITGDNLKSTETKVRELRVLYHLVKPFPTKELSAVLKHISNRLTENNFI
jgi:DNA-binding NtrC family response regulator